MTQYIAPLPDPDGSFLLRELNHRVNNELASTIYAISAKAVGSDDASVKAALLDVVEILHGYADVHNALRMPDPGHLSDAARYLQHLCFSISKYRLGRLGIRLVCSADDFWLGRTLLEAWVDRIRAAHQCGTTCSIRRSTSGSECEVD